MAFSEYNEMANILWLQSCLRKRSTELWGTLHEFYSPDELMEPPPDSVPNIASPNGYMLRLKPL